MELSQEQQEQLKKIIKNCIKQLYDKDKALFEIEIETKTGRRRTARKGLEQSALFRFGVYLNDYIKEGEIDWLKGLHLDVEYNKDGLQSKSSPRLPKGVRPDLIIHCRLNNDYSILMVEIKGWWNKKKKSRENGRHKLKGFTRQRGEFKYGLGVFLELERPETECKLEYFINGRLAGNERYIPTG